METGWAESTMGSRVAVANWNEDQVYFNENNPENQNNNARFRASVMVYVIWMAFGYPCPAFCSFDQGVLGVSWISKKCFRGGVSKCI